MNGLQSYCNLEKFHDGSINQVYRALRVSDQSPVVIKVPRSEYPSSRELARLYNEYHLLGQLPIPGIAKVYGLEKFGRTAALVMESVAGKSLQTVLGNRHLAIGECLTLAIKLTQILEELHARQIVHRDIKPSNILVDAQLEQLHLIDFGIATLIQKDGQLPTGPVTLEGTLAYLAPEQTGRMNRGIDERTDLYSLGVTLYEMLAGSLPFPVADPVELIYSHIARTPPPPHSLRPAVPETLSQIVLKLMNKMAEDRYQTAHGLRADLEACLRSWRSNQQIPSFPLGSQDRPTELRLPRRLYGRQSELAQLHDVLERVRSGALELALLSGPAGIGKTELVSELTRDLAQHGGYLARARFDEQHQAIPYGPLVRACRDLLRFLLTEPGHSLQAWKQRFLTALGGSGQLLIDLLPELELIIGPQPAAPPLPPVEAKNRFGLLFQNFLRLFASAKHPLVLFLDDLHWADEASLQFIRLLSTDPYGHYLLMVGSYRAEALDEAHPLRQQLDVLRSERVVITQLALQPLKLDDITQLLGDALGATPAGLGELAAVILNKTDGNPFFIGQFLGRLYRDRLLVFSPSSLGWQWELPRIQALPATENVADIMVVKLQQLGPRALHILQAAACVGSPFELDTVAQLCALSRAECNDALAEAIRSGLLLSTDSGYHPASSRPSAQADGGGPAADAEPTVAYRFLHERVQQAVYAMLAAEQRQSIHLRLGRLRLAQWGPDAPTGQLFELVHHLNLGSSQIQASGDEVALLELAKLNLAAGLRARATAAFHAAAGFFSAGTSLLPESSWSAHHALLFELHLERAHCDSLNGRFSEAQAQLQALKERAGSTVEQGLVQLRLCELQSARGDFAAATQAGLQGLAQLGITMPAQDDTLATFLAERTEIDRLLAGRAIADLVHLPLTQDPEVEVAVKLIVALALPSYIAGSSLYPLLMARQITLALRHGLSEQTSYACATYAFLIATIVQEPSVGYEFGQLALAMSERLASASMACRIKVALGAFYHFCRPVKETLALYERSRQEGLASGDFTYLSLACSNQAQLAVYTSTDLNASLREIDESLILMQRTKDALSILQLRYSQQQLRALLGHTGRPTSLDDSDFDVAAERQSLQKSGVGFPQLVLSWLEHMLLYLFGEHAAAVALGLGSEALFATGPGIACQTHFVFLICLSLLARYRDVPEAERKEYEAHIERHHAQLRTWSSWCPANYADREHLVAAERARVAGRSTEALMLYEEAITAARRNGFPLHEALALELAGRFHAAADRGRLATYYLTEALYAYMHLGIVAKASALLSEHSEHLRAETRALQGLNRTELTARATTSSSSSHHTTDDRLDVNSVLRASEIITRERAVEKVVDQILHTVLTSAGVQRGYLLLDRGGTLHVEAMRTISPDNVRTGLGIPLDSLGQPDGPREELALSVIHYVVRTREVVALSAGVPDARFANDAHLLLARPRAVLCLPLVSQGRLTGLLYLENTLAQVAFSPGRIDLLRILSAQAATAIENALLLHRIQEATEKVHRTNEVLEAQVTERTAALQRSNGELQTALERIQVELAERSRAEQDRALLQEQMLQAQRERLAEMSTPLIPITERIMVMPLIGTMDAERGAQIIEVALTGAQHSGAKVVILDITGLRHIDTSIAGSLIKTARALRLLGAHAIITGIRAGVAQTLVGLGVELTGLETRSTLQSAIAFALRHTGESLLMR